MSEQLQWLPGTIKVNNQHIQLIEVVVNGHVINTIETSGRYPLSASIRKHWDQNTTAWFEEPQCE